MILILRSRSDELETARVQRWFQDFGSAVSYSLNEWRDHCPFSELKAGEQRLTTTNTEDTRLPSTSARVVLLWLTDSSVAAVAKRLVLPLLSRTGSCLTVIADTTVFRGGGYTTTSETIVPQLRLLRRCCCNRCLVAAVTTPCLRTLRPRSHYIFIVGIAVPWPC